jgi:hypothetical protein
MFLGACFTDEIMTSSRIKQDDGMLSIQRKHTRKDLLAIGNIHHGSVVDADGLRHDMRKSPCSQSGATRPGAR